MAYTALTAFIEPNRIPPAGIIVTAVLAGGCPLNCAFCIVNTRNERRESSFLSADHLTTVIDSIEKRGVLGGVAIVGDEPLQAHVWPLARAALRRAGQIGVPIALISNGYNLVDFIDELQQLENIRILISLDAASEKHDAIRRKSGAFARIAIGLRETSKYPKLRQRLSIASILLPDNLGEIRGIIDFTAEHQIPELLLSPLLTSTRTEPLTVHPRIMREGWHDLPELIAHAKSAGVRLRVSDEFAMLGLWEEKLSATGVEILAPAEPARLIRLDAGGRVETLTTMHQGTTTGLQLPADISQIDSFVETLVNTCFPRLEVAA
jgi:sulfatase maturation enzyme AslB (radical SAM superfamily)